MEESQLKEEITKRIKEICPNAVEVDEILKNEFGEENVDFIDKVIEDIIGEVEINSEANIQNIINDMLTRMHYAYVKFPIVDVTNENDESIRIYDLFVRIPVNLNGKLWDYCFKMMRSTYTEAQYATGYCHSHILSIYSFSDSYCFKEPCLGRGPIKRTLITLRNEYSSEMWSLFAYELKLYVQTESLAGRPYIYMRSVSGKSEYITTNIPVIHDIFIKDFTQWLCNNDKLNFDFGFRKGSFVIGNDIVETAIRMSELFAEWYNERLFENRIIPMLEDYIDECFIDNNGIFKYSSDIRMKTDSFIQNHPAGFTFKGKEVKMKLVNETNKDTRKLVPLLKYKYIKNILFNIITTLNVYGNRSTENTKSGEKPVRVIL